MSQRLEIKSFKGGFIPGSPRATVSGKCTNGRHSDINWKTESDREEYRNLSHLRRDCRNIL